MVFCYFKFGIILVVVDYFDKSSALLLIKLLNILANFGLANLEFRLGSILLIGVILLFSRLGDPEDTLLTEFVCILP